MNRSLHKSPLVSVLESKQPSRQPLAEYKDFVREHYDGPAGAMTAVTGILTGHDVLAGQLIRPGHKGPSMPLNELPGDRRCVAWGATRRRGSPFGRRLIA